MSTPVWLPPLVLFNDYGNKELFYNALYEIYLNDFIRTIPLIKGRPLRQRREPRLEGKDKGFWHICGEDDMQNTSGTFRRHERIRWPKAVLLNRNDLDFVKVWGEADCPGAQGNIRFHFWFNDEYLVVIEKRSGYFLLITAYCTDYHRKRGALEGKYQANCGAYTL